MTGSLHRLAAEAGGRYCGVKSWRLLLDLAQTKGHPHVMSDRQPVVSDPEFIRARAMETLFERLETLCEGAIAIDRAGRVVYVNEKYLHSLRLNRVSDAIGRPIEEIILNSLMRRIAETGKPILLDIMELGGEQLVGTRMPN